MSLDPLSERFPRRVRLTHQRDFDRVFRARIVAGDSVLIVHGVANGLPYSRLGISISRRVGNAVVRNYWKRLIREAFRRQQGMIPQGVDWVVRPQRGAIADPIGIARSFVLLANKVGRRIS